MSFKELRLIEPILRALKAEGYINPTPVQEQAIPIVLNGRDLLACAQTGTGKTAAFSVPMLQLMEQDRQNGRRHIRSLILTPTRELAIQIGESIASYGRHTHLRHTVIFGGVSQHTQVRALKSGVDIIVATPGRLLDLMNQGFISLRDIEYFVLDEADRMLDMGFIHDIRKVIAKTPRRRQNLFFSATMPSEIRKLIHSIMRNPVCVDVKGTPESKADIDQFVYHVDKQSKRALLKHIISEKSMSNVLVFSRTKHGANKIVKDLVKSGISAEAIHGNKSQSARQRALTNFKKKSTRVLVATDIAARGIDINDLPFVINYELPETPETYTHRIGRTGRAGAKGYAFSMCDVNEKSYLKSINRLSANRLASIDHPFV